MADKMPSIDHEMKTWHKFRFKRSGEILNLAEMDEAVRSETIRSIRMTPHDGIAYDADDNVVASNGNLKSDTPGDTGRHYTKEELEAFGIAFLKKLAAARGIAVTKSSGPEALIRMITEWQMGFPGTPTGSPEAEPSNN